MAPKKKIDMPDDIYTEPAGAIAKLTGGAGQGTRSTASTQSTQQEKTGPTRNVKPTSIYFTPEQLKKLDDLAYVYNGRTGKRVGRNDIVRYLVDACDIGSLQGL